jgi:hypothetical protein
LSTHHIFSSALIATDHASATGLAFYGTAYVAGYNVVHIIGSRLVSDSPRSIAYGAYVGLSNVRNEPWKLLSGWEHDRGVGDWYELDRHRRAELR